MSAFDAAVKRAANDLDEVECAQRAAVTIDEAVKVISAADEMMRYVNQSL